MLRSSCSWNISCICLMIFNILTSDDKSFEAVPSYKHLGSDGSFFLSNERFNNLVRRLKGEFVLYCRNKSCFTFNAKRKLEGASFSPDISFLLRSPDSVSGRHHSPSLQFNSSLDWKVKIRKGFTPYLNDFIGDLLQFRVRQLLLIL